MDGRYRWPWRFGCTMSVTLASLAQPSMLQSQLTSVSGDTASKPPAVPLVFQGVTVVDVTDGQLVPNQVITVVGNRIQAVGPSGKVRLPVGAHVVDARGKYLIPGLWDMHPHLEHPGQADSAGQTSKYPPFYSAFIAHGVTGIRWMAQRVRIAVDSFRVWQHEVTAGTRVGPRAVGPSIDLSDNPDRVRIATPDDAGRVVDSLKAAGMAFLKYHGGSGPELYFAILREARRVGLPVVGHVPRGATEVEVADSGQYSIEHFNEHSRCWPALNTSDSAVVAEQCGRAAAAYVRRGTWLVPIVVISVHKSQKYSVSAAQNFVRTMRRYGVTKFLSGTDTGPSHRRDFGIFPGLSLLEELMLLVQSGLTPLEALQAATLNPAKYLGATDSLGTVAPNKLADLVLLDADPLANIANVMRISAVVANGRYFDRTELDALDPEGVQRLQAFAAQWSGSTKATGTTSTE